MDLQQQQRSEAHHRALARRRTQEIRGRTDLLEFIPWASPRYTAPIALSRMCDLFDRIQAGEEVYAGVEAPPRHGKSEIVFHGAARFLKYKPTKRVVYSTYSQDVADDQSRIARQRAVDAGVDFQRSGPGKKWDPSASVRHWQTAAGGGFVAVGRDGGLVSKGLDLLLNDDAFKNRGEAESETVREAVWQSFIGDQFTRREPGASVIVFHQRWNDDDLLARIRKRCEEDPENMPAFEFVSLPAIDENGKPLWADRYDLKALLQIRAVVGEYNWWSQYMQRPRPKGGSVFGEPRRYMGQAIRQGRQIVIAVDAAGTAKKSADHTAISICCYWRAPWESPEGIWLPNMLYGQVLRCYRFQLETPDVVRVLAVLQAAWPGVPIVIETQGGQGQSVAQNLRRQYPKLRLIEVPRTVDKFSAAQPCAAPWLQGRFQVPLDHDPTIDSVALQKLLRELEVWDEGKWIGPYLKEHERFTGVDGAEDDQVDSTVHNWDFADKQPASKPKVPARGSRKAAATGGY